VEVVEYAMNKGIADESVFAWWVPSVLKERDRITSAVIKRYYKRTHKFGIDCEMPKSVQHVHEMEQE
jgi:hypothetical protein